MHARSSSAVVLVYVGMVAAALAMIAFGLSTILTASAAVSQSSDTDRTLLQAQVETSREIRRALATPIVIPPLAPISAHLRKVAAASVRNRPAPVLALSQQALSSMAMAQAAEPPPAAEPEARPQPRYQVRDRLATGGW
jgi:hypothetical protein